MKKYISLILLSVAFLFLPLLVFADAAPPIGVAVLGLISAVKVGTLGAILLAVGQLLKTDLISSLIGTVNTAYMPWITLVIGVIASVGQSLLAGKPWYLGVIEGVIASIAANKTFDHFAVKAA